MGPHPGAENRAAETINAREYVPKDMGEEVVISGISASLPESNNLDEFRDHLFNKEDMVTSDDRRWEPGLHGISKRSGKLKTLDKFDASFFGVPPKLVNTMDPQLRILHEISYEALMDAGIDPKTVRGTKTGVFVGCSSSEAIEAWSRDVDKVIGYELTGCSKAMFANRLSFFYDFVGPSYVVEAACSSSLLALDQALEHIRSGVCDAALVAGSVLNVKAMTALQFQILGMLSPDGNCRAFDANADGFCRGEGIICLYVQKAKSARRVYSTVVHAKNNFDGGKVEGITYPSGPSQMNLWESVYNECGIDPVNVTYVEAHCTGTKAGDPQEGNALSAVFCKKKREKPLLIGSVKSNMGHAEPAAGLASLCKVVIAMENGMIPPNLQYETPNPAIPALSEGIMKVVVDNTPWPGGYMALNSSGFGGSNSHALFRSNQRPAKPDHPARDSQRLIVYSGRAEEGLKDTLTNVRAHGENVDLHALLEETAQTPLGSHPYRGYTLANNTNNVLEVKKAPVAVGEIWYVFSGMGTKWYGMGRDLMVFDVFRKSIIKSTDLMKPLGVDVYDLLMTGAEADFDDLQIAYVCILAIQVALVDVLNAIGIEPAGILGQSLGELACGYADGCMTADQTVLAAYWRGQSVKTANVPPGLMAVIGMSWEEAKEKVPPGVQAVAHNSANNVTVSGPPDLVNDFLHELTREGQFVKGIDTNNIAFHSQYMAPAVPIYREALNKVLTKPKLRTPRWVSTSFPESMWDSDEAKYCGSDYHCYNFANDVLFHEAVEKIPAGAVVIEIAPHNIFRQVLKATIPKDCTIISMMSKSQKDNVEYLLTNLGRTYMAGVNFNPLNLHPPVTFPVARGTPMIAPMVRWDHAQTWRVPQNEDFGGSSDGASSGSAYKFELDTAEGAEDDYLMDHNIDGRLVLPVACCLIQAWRAMAREESKMLEHTPVELMNISLHRPTIMPQGGKIKLDVDILSETSHFEVKENGALLVSGFIKMVEPDSPDPVFSKVPPRHSNGLVPLASQDVYKELRLRGYDFGPKFQNIHRTENTGHEGQLLWRDNWVTFLDSVMQSRSLTMLGRSFRLPSGIKYIRINPETHMQKIVTLEDGTKVIPVQVNNIAGTLAAGGVFVSGMKTSVASRRQQNVMPEILEAHQFVPYFENNLFTDDKDLVSYQRQCERSLQEGLAKMLSNGTPKNLYNVELLKMHVLKKDFNADERRLSESYNPTEDDTLLNVLDEIFSNIHDPNFTQLAKDVVASNHAALIQDRLLGCVRDERALKTCMDLVFIQVGSNHKLRICEYEATSGMMFNDVISQMSTHAKLLSLLEYTALVPADNSNLELPVDGGVATLKWNIGESVPTVVTVADVVITHNFSVSQSNLREALVTLVESVKEDGFVLLCEPTRNFSIPLFVSGVTTDFSQITDSRSCGPFCTEEVWQEIIEESGLDIVAQKSDGFMNTLFLCRKCRDDRYPADQTVIDVESEEFEWVEDIKAAVEESENNPDAPNIWLKSEHDKTSGVIGLLNCLREEPAAQNIRCYFNASLDPEAEIPPDSFESLVRKDLVTNVYRDGQWGTFRHIAVNRGTAWNQCMTKHAFVNTAVKGDIASAQWVESPLKFSKLMKAQNAELCNVYCAAVNPRDILYATGKLQADEVPERTAMEDCIMGMEFAGKDQNGRRVMGIVPTRGLATHVYAKKNFIWEVPEKWSLREAATVPLVFTRAYFTLVIRGGIKKGDRILIYQAETPLGQAAIAVALQQNCEVFAAVRSQEDAIYIKESFPAITDDHLAISENPLLQWDMMNKTDDGMDVIFNALAADKLQASLHLIKSHGQMLETSKVVMDDYPLLASGASMHSIVVRGVGLQYDELIEGYINGWTEVSELFVAGIKDGTVKPMGTVTFSKDQIHDALWMAQTTTTTTKKVLIEVADEQAPHDINIKAMIRTAFHPDMSYIITGGLGGYGMELAHWMVGRGATKLVLSTRSGVRDGYQSYSIRRWTELGVQVKVCVGSVTNYEDTDALVTEAIKLGPVGGIFHLAMVLDDQYIAQQTPEGFKKVSHPKIFGVRNLDKLSRQKCPNLEYFVMFSSVSSGRGNMGQANYGTGNSVMERVCEHRRRDGLPAVAIQWGPIGDVGAAFTGNNEAIINGLLLLRLSSSLAALDFFMNKPYPVTASHAIAKRVRKNASSDIVDEVANILGIDDVKTIDPDISLGELGLDSLMGVEVRQTLQREIGVMLTMQEIRQLTVNSLKALSSSSNLQAEGKAVGSQAIVSNGSQKITVPLNKDFMGHYDINQLMPKYVAVKLNDGPGSLKDDTPMFIISPMAGTVVSLRSMASKLKCAVYAFQYTNSVPMTTIEDLATFFIKKMKEIQPVGPYKLVGYCYGACVAFEMCLQLEKNGEQVPLMTLMDGSHKRMFEYAEYFLENRATDSFAELQSWGLCMFVQQFIPVDFDELMALLQKREDWPKRLQAAVSHMTATGHFTDEQDVKEAAQAFYLRQLLGQKYQPAANIHTKITLIRALKHYTGQDTDFGLSEVCDQKVDVELVKGDNKSFIIGDGGNTVAGILNKLYCE